VDTYGTGKVSESRLREIINQVFDLRPRAIIEYLDLLRPIYSPTSAYGHFGRNEPGFTWEKTNKVEAIQELL
jgi:S-adenosylmethionine synthetase